MFMHIRIICMSFVFVFMVTSVHSQPYVNYIDGIIQDGKKIRISGSNFGSNPNPAPIIYDDFEDGVNGANLNTGDWITAGSTDEGKYSTANPRTGKQSASWHFNKGAFYHNYQEIAAQNAIYFSFWVYNDGLHATGCKIGRSTYSDHYYGRPIMRINAELGSGFGSEYRFAGSVADGNGNSLFNYLASSRPKHNQWYRVEFYTKLNKYGSSNGKSWFGMVGLNRGDRENLVIRTASNQFFDQFMLGVGVNAFTNSGNIFIDDLYVSNTEARVEIGEKSNFNNCKHREIQVLSSWTGNEIELRFKQGTFEDGDLVYLFVVDSNGNPSPGYGPFAIGGDGTIIGDSSMTAPQGLSIKIE